MVKNMLFQIETIKQLKVPYKNIVYLSYLFFPKLKTQNTPNESSEHKVNISWLSFVVTSLILYTDAVLACYYVSYQPKAQF